jgi:hypothetical protein
LGAHSRRCAGNLRARLLLGIPASFWSMTATADFKGAHYRSTVGSLEELAGLRDTPCEVAA